MRSTGRAAVVAAVALAMGGGAWLWWRDGGPSLAPDRAAPRPDSVLAVDGPGPALIRAALADVDARPRDADAWYRLSLAYQGSSAATPALECLEQAVALDRRHAKAWYHLALVRDHSGDRAGAIEAMQRAVAIDGGYGPAHQRLGEFRLDDDDLVAAQRAFEAARRVDPAAITPLVGLARVAARRGDDPSAIALLAPAARRADDPLACQVLGSALARAGRPAEAEALLARAQRPAPAPPDPWRAEIEPYRVDERAQLQRAQHLVMTGRVDEAIPILESLVRSQPDNAGLVCNLAAAWRTKGRPEDLNRAAAILEDAVRTMPSAWQPRYNLALVRFAAWRGSKAAVTPDALRGVVEQVQLAIACNPSYAPAHALRGDVHSALGEFSLAAEAYGRAAVAEPANAAWPAQRGTAELRASRPGSAIEALRVAARLAPGDPSIVAMLAEAFDAAGRPDEAAQARARVEAMTAGLRPTVMGRADVGAPGTGGASR